MSKTVDKIKSLASKAANERIADERQKIDEKVNSDLKVIETILEMVKDRLVYKETTQYRRKTYAVVDEDTVYHDYTTKPEGYNSGKTGVFVEESSWYSPRQTKIYVNGHLYYHAKDLFTKYEHEIRKATEMSDSEREIINKKKEALETLKELEPVVKQILLNHQKHLGGNDLDASDQDLK